MWIGQRSSGERDARSTSSYLVPDRVPARVPRDRESTSLSEKRPGDSPSSMNEPVESVHAANGMRPSSAARKTEAGKTDSRPVTVAPSLGSSQFEGQILEAVRDGRRPRLERTQPDAKARRLTAGEWTGDEKLTPSAHSPSHGAR